MLLLDKSLGGFVGFVGFVSFFCLHYLVSSKNRQMFDFVLGLFPKTQQTPPLSPHQTQTTSDPDPCKYERERQRTPDR